MFCNKHLQATMLSGWLFQFSKIVAYIKFSISHLEKGCSSGSEAFFVFPDECE